MDRRAFLGGASAFGVSAAFTRPASAAEPDLAVLLEKRISTCLFTTTGASAAPMQVDELRARLDRARAGYDACRYVWLADELPRLISAAEATMTEAPTTEAAALASASYQLTAHALAKLLVSGVQPMAADRAVTRAQQAGDPLVLAQARRVLSTAARRIGDYEQAERVGIRAIEDLPLARQACPATGRHAVELWCVAGYAAAVRGDRDRSVECYREATSVAAHIDDPAILHRPHHTPALIAQCGQLGQKLPCLRGGAPSGGVPVETFEPVQIDHARYRLLVEIVEIRGEPEIQ
ncbi:hypothetical protein [Saccharopolyspora hattusasensis]|uniref:hypothetical protein n=1 Tax=Saccharopolyspora hattusasensis TaxID=1128679 RepID=UPI003D99F482